ncbi:unnamed protein product [Candidula unifasciata]|uniref:ATPase AAA-type core domain-containing protein n=1 Tax=Candidula unifasciata TaxID=100452 RepID=A0A8S3Z0E0_9EUPU|nr:unnamed protein product [Candidula unifasciata]
MVHPQKRQLVNKCIEGVTGRIIELRHELFRINMSEYAPFGPFCVEQQILPSDLDMELSRTFRYDKVQRLQRRADLLDYILVSMGKSDDVDSMSVSTQMNPDFKIQEPSTAYNSQQPTRPPSVSDQIQMKRKNVNWRKVLSQFKIFQNRLVLVNMRSYTDGFLNMAFRGKYPQELEQAEQQVVLQRIQTAQEHADEYVQRVILETETLQDSDAARNLAEDIQRNILQWMLECRAVTGTFPEYPAVDLGGAAAIFSHKTLEEVADELDFGVDEKARAKAKGKAKERKPGKKELPEGFTMRTSNFLDDVLVDVSIEYDAYWKFRDESSNFKQDFSLNLLTQRVHENLEDILREQIDEEMRQQLDILTMAVEKTRMAKAKPKKVKPEKKKKKDKRKRLKDLTPNVEMEDLFSELVRNDVIKRVRPLTLNDFIGDVNLVAEGDSARLQCQPDLGDIRKMIFDFVILPMSNGTVRERVPCCKSLLIVGPHGCGKKMLVHAICNELGANLFDLTAHNIRDAYTDRDGPQMLMHLVMKVGKALEPSVIFIDDCELMFTKKLPPEVKSSPARIKSSLVKAMKTVGLDDRIMLIGTTSRPYLAAKGPLLKMYERVVFIYPPAYASRYTLWRSAIRLYEGVVTRSLMLSTLAQISSNFTANDIFNTARQVLTAKRLKRQNIKPLHTIEFGDVLSESTPIYVEELDALVTWLKETPLSKKREEVRALEAAGINIFDML